MFQVEFQVYVITFQTLVLKISYMLYIRKTASSLNQFPTSKANKKFFVMYQKCLFSQHKKIFFSLKNHQNLPNLRVLDVFHSLFWQLKFYFMLLCFKKMHFHNWKCPPTCLFTLLKFVWGEGRSSQGIKKKEKQKSRVKLLVMGS